MCSRWFGLLIRGMCWLSLAMTIMPFGRGFRTTSDVIGWRDVAEERPVANEAAAAQAAAALSIAVLSAATLSSPSFPLLCRGFLRCSLFLGCRRDCNK